MAKATVTLRVTPNEAQVIQAALACYAYQISQHKYSQVDLTPTEKEPLMAERMARRLILEIGLKS